MVVTSSLRYQCRERYLYHLPDNCWLVKADVLRFLLAVLVTTITRVAPLHSADYHHLLHALLHQDHLGHGGRGHGFFCYILELAFMKRHLL